MSASPLVRWIAWFLVAIAFAVACVFLANWQFDRRAEAVAKMQRVVNNYDRAAIGFEEVPKANEVIELEWHPVEVRGSYVFSKQLLVRNRPIAGQPGFLQLVPFRTTTGELIIVERGWIPADSTLSPTREYELGSDEILLQGRIRLPGQTPNRPSPGAFVTSINLSDISEILGENSETRFYLRLISETPAQQSNPQPLGRPLLDEGNHLSYAVQWIIFALMGFFALFWAIRQEREYKRMAVDPSYVPKKRKDKTKVDGDIEDELLEVPK